MTQCNYGREREVQGYDSPEHLDPAHIPLERDIRQRHRTPQRYNEGQGRKDGPDTPLLGVLVLAIGAGAVLAWYKTKGGSDNQRRLSGHQADQRRHVPIDETDNLIASNKVEGTAVYDRGGEKIGTVHNFMVGKRSGWVAYAVINFGGVLGFGGSYHPLPWSALTYDEDQGGYVVDIDKDRLRNAPKHQENEDPFSTPAYGRQVREYWLVLR